jgi:hypothetical protein
MITGRQDSWPREITHQRPGRHSVHRYVRGYWMTGFHEAPNEHWIETPQPGDFKQYAVCGIVCTGGIEDSPLEHNKCPVCRDIFSANGSDDRQLPAASRPESKSDKNSG